MSFRDALLADPLFMVLTGRGMSRADAYDACEQIATRTADGEPELDAIEAVLGFVPLSERERLESLSKPNTPPPTPEKGPNHV